MMAENSRKEQQAVLDIALKMNSIGLNQGSSGNVSVRSEAGMVITPSALPYEQSTPDDIVLVAMNGRCSGINTPSSEWRLHRDIYQNVPEAGAVLHVHPPWCTTLACLDREIPAFHYMIALAGGNSIRCAAYALFGTEQLSDNVMAALDGRKACLMSHHGMICHAENLDKVLALAIEVENLARVYCQSLQIGTPKLLDDQQMEAVLQQFASYRNPGS